MTDSVRKRKEAEALSERFSTAGVWGITPEIILENPTYWTPEYADRMQQLYTEELASRAATERLFAPLEALLGTHFPRIGFRA